MTQPIPEGYATITPYLMVDDPEALVAWMEKAFGAEVRHLMKDESGHVMNAEVQVGSSRVMLGGAREEWPARETDFYMYVEDCDAVYAAAVAAGGTSVMEPEDQAYGDRHGGVQDLAGNRWWIATHIEDVTVEEVQERMAGG